MLSFKSVGIENFGLSDHILASITFSEAIDAFPAFFAISTDTESE